MVAYMYRVELKTRNHALIGTHFLKRNLLKKMMHANGV